MRDPSALFLFLSERMSGRGEETKTEAVPWPVDLTAVCGSDDDAVL